MRKIPRVLSKGIFFIYPRILDLQHDLDKLDRVADMDATRVVFFILL
jgi:hypothetical protein